MKGSLNINEFVNDLYIRINKEISILKNKNLNQFDLIQKKLIYYTQVLKTLYEIIENEETPIIIFT